MQEMPHEGCIGRVGFVYTGEKGGVCRSIQRRILITPLEKRGNNMDTNRRGRKEEGGKQAKDSAFVSMSVSDVIF